MTKHYHIPKEIPLNTPAIREIANYYNVKIPRYGVTKTYLVQQLCKAKVLSSDDPYKDLLEKHKIISEGTVNGDDKFKTQLNLWLSSMPQKY
jgi:hypothetical protein